MAINPVILYFLEIEIQKYLNDPEHYQSYEEWGKELDEEYERCVAELKKNEDHT
jgi:hypothetical protein